MLSNKKDFVPEKYTGKWYELLHFPAFFQRSDTYNTTAEYTVLEDGSLDVLNTTFSKGEKVTSHGIARPVGHASFRVDFDAPDVEKFSTKGFKPPTKDDGTPNYLIKHIWTDDRDGSYIFAVVTDYTNTSLWVLSRTAHPTQEEYEEVLAYVIRHYGDDKFVSTSHYDRDLQYED